MVALYLIHVGQNVVTRHHKSEQISIAKLSCTKISLGGQITVSGNPIAMNWCVPCNVRISPWQIYRVPNEYLRKSKKCVNGCVSGLMVVDIVSTYSTVNIRVFHDKEIWHISVRLSDRSEVTQHKINFIKNCSQWGLNPQPPDHHSSQVTIWLWVWIIKTFIKSCSIDFRNKQSPTCEVVHDTKENSLQKSPTDSSLAQLSEHQTDDLEVVSSNPTGNNFWQNLVCAL